MKQADDVAVPCVGHHAQQGFHVCTVHAAEVYRIREEFIILSITEDIIVVIFFRGTGQRLINRHPLFELVFVIAIVQAYRLQPTGQSALAPVVLHLALAGRLARSKDDDVYLVHELLAAPAVSVIVVVDGLEQGIALLVEVAASNRFIPPDEG